MQERMTGFAMFSTLIKLWCAKLGLVLPVLGLGYTTIAQQVSQTDRFEMPSTRDERAYEIIPAHEDGLYLHRRLFGSNVDQIELVRLDTAFSTPWRGFLEVDRKYILMASHATGGRLYFLLRFQDFTNNNFQLYAIDNANGDYLKYNIKNFIPFSPLEFQITEKAAIFGGYYNHVPVVLYYSFVTGRSNILPGLLNETGELTQIKVYPDGTFDVLIGARNHLGQQTVWIKNYSAEGELQSNYALLPDGNKHLIFARSIKTEGNMQLVAGVYGSRNSEYSRGLFMASIDPSGYQQLRYYGYGDLDNFFKYMKAKREQRVRQRIERRKVRGKRIRFSYRFLVHEIVPFNNQYILLGEAFYPRYISMDRPYYSGFFNASAMFRNAIVRDGLVFDGYHYTHAVVMGFDRDGKLLWDNSFEIKDVKTFTLEQFVKLEVQEDRIALLYLFENELRTKIIQNDQVLEGKSYKTIKTSFENEIVTKERTNFNRLEYWYQDYFYAYGVQDITNPTTGKRRVFFINKIRYN
jgi:hypothetical protein